jgi:2-acylglycerol O-acyltransferase 2
MSILKGYNLVAAFIVVVIALAYLPWSKGPVLKRVQKFYSECHPYYYKSMAVKFEGTSLPTPDDPQTFYAIHPHGAFCIGWSNLFSSPLLSHVKFCFSPALYTSPFFRLFSRCVGNPGSASRSDMISYLKNGIHLALPPGGFEEATLTSTTQDRVFIKKRTGFIKLCLQHGVAVRPVYVFGERNLFWNIQGFWKLRLAMNRHGLPMILVWGHPLMPLMPKTSAKLLVVVGAPLVLPTIEKPSKEDVALWHGKYMVALTKLFDEHKEEAYENGKEAKLEVW